MTNVKVKTLRDLLSEINISGEDTDVTVDGIGSIAVCPPVEMTKKGLEHFKPALEAPLMEDEEYVVSCPTEEQDEDAWNFLYSLAGYCPETKFNEWFEGEDATEL